jgi:hypothetical protein
VAERPSLLLSDAPRHRTGGQASWLQHDNTPEVGDGRGHARGLAGTRGRTNDHGPMRRQSSP